MTISSNQAQTGEMIGHMALRPGDVIVSHGVLVTILRHGEGSTETVFPPAGRECWLLREQANRQADRIVETIDRMSGGTS